MKRSNQRGYGKRGLETDCSKLGSYSGDVFILEGRPHLVISSKCPQSIHHGGAATDSRRGIRRAGRYPASFIPHGHDQFDAGGRRVFELGVGASPFPVKTHHAERLSEAVIRLSENISTGRPTNWGKIHRWNRERKRRPDYQPSPGNPSHDKHHWEVDKHLAKSKFILPAIIIGR